MAFSAQTLGKYFDLYRDVRAPKAQAPAPSQGSERQSAEPHVAPDPNKPADSSSGDKPKQIGLPWQWLALLLGVIIQPALANYQATHQWKLDGAWGWVAFSVIVAIVAFPAVYRSTFDPNKPLVIQIIPIFTAGLGWQSLFTTAVKAVTSS